MKISLKTAVLSASLLISMQPMLKADEQKKCIFKKDVAEALTHVLTHMVAAAGAGAMIGCGVLLDETVKKKAEIETYYLGGIAGVTAGLYMLYNMPQWTDTYILNKDTQRSRAQNIIVFLSRTLGAAVMLPILGVVLGEGFNTRPQDAGQAPQASVTACNAEPEAAEQVS